MSENNFDKHILDEMSQLRIKPGPHLWAQVQADLRKRRRRRFIALVLPFLFIGSVVGWWYFNQPTQSELIQPLSNLNQLNDQNSTLIDTNQTLPATSENVILPKEDIASGVISDQSKPASFNNSILADHKPKSAIRARNFKHEVASIDSELVTEADKSYSAVSHSNDTTELIEQIKVSSEILSDQSNQNIITKNTVDSIIGESIALNQPENNTQTDSVITSTPPKPIRKWSFGLQTSIGKAGVGSGPIGKSLFKSSMVYNSSPGERASNYYTNKEELQHHSNNYYQVGLWASKPISNRLSIQSGLSYEYYSTTTNVGWRIVEEEFQIETERLPQSPNVIYYAPGSRFTETADQLLAFAMPIKSQEFNNYWHFISIPLQVNYLLTPVNGKFGVSLMGGVKFQRLVTEEIVHFDERNGIMFRMEDLVNKNQISIHSGINFELLRNKRFPISVMPIVGYQTNQFYKSNPSTNHHSWTGGVTVGVKLF